MPPVNRFFIEIRPIGLVEYELCLELQRAAIEEVSGDPCKAIILVTRHPKVITLGRRSSSADLLLLEEELLKNGIKVARCERGGGATYHYPGQAVIYPILNICKFTINIPEYIRMLGESARIVLSKYGIDSIWLENKPGLYVEGKKIASIGLKISKEITSHGIAVNVTEEIEGFKYIVACCDANLSFTSIEHLKGERYDPDHIGCEIGQEIKFMLTKRYLNNTI